MTGRTIVADIGGTFIKYGIVDGDYHILCHKKVPTREFADQAAFFDYLCENLPEDAGADRIGISAPGLIDPNGRVRSYAAPRLAALFGADIPNEVTARTGLFTAALNDGKAAGLCEWKLGNGRGTTLSAYLIIGTGAGGCICTKDGIFGGADNFAGEFHFMAYPNEATGETMKVGRVIGTIGLIARYNERAGKARQVTEAKEITDRYFAGEALAAGLVEDWLHRVAMQCLTIVVTLNPEILCIGGGISEEDWFLEGIRQEYHRLCMAHFEHVDFLTTKIDRCRFRNDANLLGAAIWATEHRQEEMSELS